MHYIARLPKGFMEWNCRWESERGGKMLFSFSWQKLANKSLQRPRESDFFRRRRHDKRRRNSICGILNVPDFEFGSKNVFTQFSCSSQAFHCISPQWNINLSHLCGFVCPPLIFLYFVFLLPLEGWWGPRLVKWSLSPADYHNSKPFIWMSICFLHLPWSIPWVWGKAVKVRVAATQGSATTIRAPQQRWQ